jgi:hypothetical protein
VAVIGGDGGSGSSSGAPSVNAVCRDGAPTDDPKLEMVDDLEDGNARLMANGGRTGSWAAPHDDTKGGVQAPDPFTVTEIAGCTNRRYAHTRGRGFSDWGSHLTFNFMSGKAAYDVSKYAGITFWARSQRGTKIRVNFPNKDTDTAGMLCQTMPGKGTTVGCHNHFGVELTLAAAWTKHTVLFKDIKQEPYWGRQAETFDAANVYSMTMAIPKGVTYDVWVDDVAFILK